MGDEKKDVETVRYLDIIRIRTIPIDPKSSAY
jgi:transient-receptor-potential-like protein